MTTGIIRKVDELGRVVIPKEIRKVLDVKTGSSLEISIYENQILLKKFSEVENLNTTLWSIADSFYKVLNIPIAICNENKVIDAIGLPKRGIVNKILNCNMLNKKNASVLELLGVDMPINVHIHPINSECYINGYLLLFYGENQKDVSAEAKIALEVMCAYINGLICFE